MNPTALRLPARAAKPRRAGLTMVIDGGIPTAHFADLVSSAAEYIDFVKFGWGTAVVTSGLRQYVQHARHREERGDGAGTPVRLASSSRSVR